MRYKKIFHEFDVLFFSIIVLTSLGFLNNANALFHDQGTQQDGVIDDSKKIIESLFDRVNIASNNYQSEISFLNQSINDNETMRNTTQGYIDNLKEIILFAKKTTVQQDYKPVLNNYIDSIENEIESYVHYKEYIITGNLTENKISMNLLSKAFNFETQAIKLYKQLELQ
ncbi:MAG: hypothetical protein ACRD8K_09115 [Nitrososphaeraceae archaeon]